MNNDLTYGRNFADFLGSFWSSIFDGGALGDAIGYSCSEMLLQSYMDVMEIINSSSIYSIPTFSRKNVLPVIINESDMLQYAQVPSYGDGGFYGQQPDGGKYRSGSFLKYGTPAKLSDSYFYPLPQSVVSLGSFAVNRLFQPSVTLANGADFILSADDGGIVFKSNPFSNPLIPVADVLNTTTGEMDKQIVIWFCDVDEDTFRLHDQYGFIFTNLQESSEQYKIIIQSVFELVSKGPSISALDSFLSAVSGSPLIREVSETVEVIQDTPEGYLIITDKSVYSLLDKTMLRNNIVVGAVLPASTPLSTVVEVVDTTMYDWWEEFPSLPLKPGYTTNTNQFLSFPNISVPAVYGQNNSPAQPLSQSVAFTLIGDPMAIKDFWASVNEKAGQTGNNYGFELFSKYSDSTNPETDFTNQVDFFLNPAQILAEDLCTYSILPIKININYIQNLDIFFKTINPLKLSTPVHVILMLFLEINLIDQYQLAASSNQTQTDSVNLNDLIEVNFNDFPSGEQALWSAPPDTTGILEAISIDASSSSKGGRSYGSNNFYDYDLDYRGFLIEQFDLSNTSNLVQTLEIKQIPKCAT